MLLHEFMLAHRTEILELCERRSMDRQKSERTVVCAADLFEEIASFLQSAFGSQSVLNPCDARAELGASETLVGASAAVVRVRIAINRLSKRSRAPVLVTGEFGTGKRHCARLLHNETYPDGEFFELGGVEELPKLEQRMGALRVRASGEAGLTVYVHELCELPGPIQLQLGKLLTEQGTQLRLVASSSRNLTQAVREGLLRPELAFRFPTELALPPLRERLDDLPALVSHFAERCAATRGGVATQLAESAWSCLEEHSWPGNLTELRNLIDRLNQDFGPRPVQAVDLPELAQGPLITSVQLPRTGINLAEVERTLVIQALEMAGNNQTRAASLLGLSRDQLRYRLAKFEISASTSRR